MRILKNPKADIPDGWFFDCEETKFRVVTQKDQDTFIGLLSCVAAHMYVNDIDIPAGLDRLIQHQISQRLPQELSKEID